MCHTIRKIHTVCAHSREEGPFDCHAQKNRRERLQYSRFCSSLRASISRCWPPVKLTELIYGFCEDCRFFYAGRITRRVSVILNYWACRGYSNSVSPGSIPSAMVFCKTSSEEDLKRPRCELIALAKVLPRGRGEPREQWLQRLEVIRRSTLEWAENTSSPQTHDQRALDQSDVRAQPRPAPPTSVHPYGHVPSRTQGLTENQEAVVKPFLSSDSGRSPQVHPETLNRLCGEISPDFHTPQPGGEPKRPQQASIETVTPTTHCRVAPDVISPTRRLIPGQKKYGHEDRDRVGNDKRLRAESSTCQKNDIESSAPAPIGKHLAETTDRATLGDVVSRALVPAPLRILCKPNHPPRRKSARGHTRADRESQEGFIHLRGGCPVIPPYSPSAGNNDFSNANLGGSLPQQLDDLKERLTVVEERNRTSRFSYETLVDAPTEPPQVGAGDSQGCSINNRVEEECEPNMTSRFSISDIDLDDAAEIAEHVL